MRSTPAPKRQILTDRYFSPFRLFVARQARLALVLNPKVGSTFLRDLLAAGYREQLGRDDPSEGRYRLLSMARRMPVARVGDYLDFLRAPERYAIHSIVRNPYARMLSAWRDKFRDGHTATPDGADRGYPPSIRRGVLARVRAHAARHGLPGARAGELVPFETFLSYVETEPEGRRNSHWEEQRRVILHDRLPYTSVLRLEDGIGAPLAGILAPLGFDPGWVMERCARPKNTSATLRRPAYDAALAARVLAIHRADFDAFGYDPDSWKGL